MTEHECVFVEEQEPSGRLILPPCIVCGLTAMDALEQLREAQEHIARWLDDHPPLSTTERVERGSTGDLSVDMMRYASRLKARADRAEAALTDLRTRVEALTEKWDGRSRDVDDLLDELCALLNGDES